MIVETFHSHLSPTPKESSASPIQNQNFLFLPKHKLFQKLLLLILPNINLLF